MPGCLTDADRHHRGRGGSMWELLGQMKNIPRPLLVAGPCVLTAALALAQTAVPRLPPASPNPPAASVQAPLDPGYAALIAACKTPPPARGGRGPGGPGGGARGVPPPQGVRDSTIAEIPG